jgi:hypothetical protein
MHGMPLGNRQYTLIQGFSNSTQYNGIYQMSLRILTVYIYIYIGHREFVIMFENAECGNILEISEYTPLDRSDLVSSQV